MKRKTTITFFLIIIAIFVIGIGLRISLARKAKSQVTSEQAIVVEAMRVKKNYVGKIIELIGAVMADKTAQVFPETMGRVTRILVKDGSRVSKGDDLMSIRNEAVGFEFEEAMIKSPIAGSIANVLVDVGSMVSTQVPVAIVVDFSKVKVSFNVAEVDAGYLKKSGKITIKIDALPDEVFNGTISEISPVVDPLTRTIAVKADITNGRGQLKPGMTARILLNLGERKNVLAVPKDALMNGIIYVAENDSIAERREVKTGLIGDEWAEITEGLQENELVIIIGQQRLAGGEKIKTIVRN